jgi:hypothetical protein
VSCVTLPWIGTNLADTALEVGTSAAGAAVGGVAGYLAGVSQSAHQVVITRTYPIPDLISKDLGRIPNDFSEYDWGWNSWFPPSHVDGDHGWHEVYRNVPRYDASGGVIMKPYTETLTSRQFGPVAGAFAGAAIRAGLGLLAGWRSTSRSITRTGLTRVDLDAVMANWVRLSANGRARCARGGEPLWTVCAPGAEGAEVRSRTVGLPSLRHSSGWRYTSNLPSASER